MPNVNNLGIRPWGSILGGCGVLPSPITRPLVSGYGTAVGLYDPVKPVSDGTLAIAAAEDTTICGVVVGLTYVTGGVRVKTNYIPASTTFTPSTVGSRNESLVTYIPAYPGVLFQMDVNTAAADLATAIGYLENNADHVAGTADASTGGKYVLNGAGFGTGSAQWRVHKIVGYPTEAGGFDGSNDVTATHWKVLVWCNESIYDAGTGGSGI